MREVALFLALSVWLYLDLILIGFLIQYLARNFGKDHRMKGSHDLFPYPEIHQFPAAVRNVIAYIRKTDPNVDLSCAVNCGYGILGMGLAMIPHEHPLPADVGARGAGTPEEQLATALEPHASSRGDADAAALPWDVIIPLVVQVIMEWLRRRS